MSLITYPVGTMPRVFLPRSFSAGLQTNTRSFASPFGGSEQVADMLNDRWAFALELAARNHDEAASVEAFLAAMRGMSNTTNLYHFGRPTPRGTLAGSPALVAPAAQGAASITVGAVAGQTLRAGDMLGIGGLLVQVAADCVADASGAMVVPLASRLRRAVAGLSRASTATYIDDFGVLQTAGVNVPRFQGGALLVEGAGTNLVRQSESITAAQWVNAVGTTSTRVDAGDGLSLGNRFLITATSVNGGVRQAFGGLTLGQRYVWSFYIESTASAVNLLLENGPNSYGGSGFTANFSPVTGVFSSVTSGVVVGAVALGPGWLVHVLLPPAGGALVGNLEWRMPVSGGSFFLGRPQFEPGTAPTSYIPTTTAPATRAADVVTPVVWDRPTGTFRLASQPRVVYLGGYAEAVAMDFVEAIA